MAPFISFPNPSACESPMNWPNHGRNRWLSWSCQGIKTLWTLKWNPLRLTTYEASNPHQNIQPLRKISMKSLQGRVHCSPTTAEDQGVMKRDTSGLGGFFRVDRMVFRCGSTKIPFDFSTCGNSRLVFVLFVLFNMLRLHSHIVCTNLLVLEMALVFSGQVEWVHGLGWSLV